MGGEVVVAGRACLIGAHTESICIATRTVGNTTEVFAYCMTGVVTSTQEIITRARVASVDRCSFISAHFVVSSFSIWFHLLFFFFFAFCFVTVGVYLHEPVVVAFNFLHGVLFMIAKLPCSSGRQGQVGAGMGCRGTQEAVPEWLGVSMVALSISVCGIWMINVFT